MSYCGEVIPLVNCRKKFFHVQRWSARFATTAGHVRGFILGPRLRSSIATGLHHPCTLPLLREQGLCYGWTWGRLRCLGPRYGISLVNRREKFRKYGITTRYGGVGKSLFDAVFTASVAACSRLPFILRDVTPRSAILIRMVDSFFSGLLFLIYRMICHRFSP